MILPRKNGVPKENSVACERRCGSPADTWAPGKSHLFRLARCHGVSYRKTPVISCVPRTEGTRMGPLHAKPDARALVGASTMKTFSGHRGPPLASRLGQIIMA